MAYSIFDYLEHLIPVDGHPGEYLCPCCGAENFKIGRNGAYQCWSGQCEPSKIRTAIDRLAGKEPSRSYRSRPRPMPHEVKAARAITERVKQSGFFESDRAVDPSPPIAQSFPGSEQAWRDYREFSGIQGGIQ